MTTATIFKIGAVFLFCSSVMAQAPVANRQAVPAAAPDNSLQLVIEIQSLREEISSLRGTVEELQYQVRKLEQKQAEDYADIDGRVADLYSGSVSGGAAGSGNNSTNRSPNEDVAVANQTASLANTPANAQPAASSNAEASSRLYDQGFSALRKGDREAALQAFGSLVEAYPQAREAADARYWLGETYWLANQKEQSRQSFVQLLELTPDYRKAGDAMYRLGIIYDQLGDFDTAFDYMSQVLLSGSSQAFAAQAWINEHQPENSETE